MKVRFKNSNGGSIVGFLYRPFRKTDKAIIFCHGFAGMKEQFKLWANYFSFRGFITLTFDFTGNGESEGFFTEGTFSQEISDVKSAVDFLKQNYGIRKIALVGHSMGGAVAVLSASKNKDVDCVVVLAPLAVIKGKPYGKFANEEADIFEAHGLCDLVNCKKMRTLDLAFFKDVKRHDVLKSVKSLKIPLLVIHGNSDSIVSVKEGLMLHNAAVVKNKRVEIIKGADHDFAKRRLKISGIILDWCRKYLK
jgi:alpha-beta hydrolase superfamily lysophospholipase